MGFDFQRVVAVAGKPEIEAETVRGRDSEDGGSFPNPVSAFAERPIFLWEVV